MFGLYDSSRRQAALFCVAEQTASKRSMHSTRYCLRTRRPSVTVFKPFRHGPLSLYSLLDIKSEQIAPATLPRNSSLLSAESSRSKSGRGKSTSPPITSTNKTKRVTQFLADYLNVHLHFTPTYSSWLKSIRILVRQDRVRCCLPCFHLVNELACHIRHRHQHAVLIDWPCAFFK